MLICDSVGLAVWVKLSVLTVYLWRVRFFNSVRGPVGVLVVCKYYCVPVVSVPDISFLTGIMPSPFQF